ncbi:MAG: prolyl oligopeptidase family serine peptidase [Bacteroidetes bacterium]|nr:prolyl oligopeptidase family serine peptidase [Bacteroidota bacterium]
MIMSSTPHSGIALFLGACFLLCAIPHSFAQGRVETGFLNRTLEIAGSMYRYQVYVPSGYTPTQAWPVIVFLHGAGERGHDGLIQTQVGLGAAIRQNASRYPAIVVFPQCPADSLWVGTPARAAMAALEKTQQEFRTDADRVYITGLSMGGNGTWYLAYRHPETFAAVVPICGWIQRDNPWVRNFEPVVTDDTTAPFQAVAKKLARVPVWIFHGEADGAVPVDQSRQAAAALTAVGAPVHYTELPGTGHNSWDAAYNSEKFAAWLLGQRRNR